MITIITGKIHSGKTTRLLKAYQENRLGDGFISLKMMEGSQVVHFDAFRLSTEEKKILAIHDLFKTDQFEYASQLGPYHFVKETLEWIESTMDDLIEATIEPLYLDEVGKLEMSGKGFNNILIKMLEANLDVYIVVRDDLLEDVVRHYQLNDYRLITM